MGKNQIQTKRRDSLDSAILNKKIEALADMVANALMAEAKMRVAKRVAANEVFSSDAA
jgi:hypothetical protein